MYKVGFALIQCSEIYRNIHVPPMEMKKYIIGGFKSNVIWNFDKDIPGHILEFNWQFWEKISSSCTLYKVYDLEFFSQNCRSYSSV